MKPGALRRAQRPNSAASSLARVSAARMAATKCSGTCCACMWVMAAWVVPPLLVTRWRSTSALSVERAASSDAPWKVATPRRSEEHTSELQSHSDLVCRLLLAKKKEVGTASRWHVEEI